MKSRVIFVCLVVTFLAGTLGKVESVQAENTYTFEIIEYGYYKKLAELKRHRNIAATTGYVREGGDVELEQQSTEIPLQLNRLFGFKFRISGFGKKEAVQLKLVVSHPEIKRPNGSVSRGYSYPVLLAVKDGVIENQSGYSIDHEYEMVEGDWTFEYWYNNEKLLSHSFKTVKPESETANEENPGEETSSDQAQNTESAS